MAESGSRRRSAKPVGFARVGSNPTPSAFFLRNWMKER